MVVDVGVCTTDIALLSLADVFTSFSLRLACYDMYFSIVNYIKATYNILVLPLTS